MLWIASLLLLSVSGLQIINHVPGSAGLNAQAQPVHRTLVQLLQRGPVHENWSPATQQRFLRGLGDALLADQCVLSYSGFSREQIALKFYCPHTMDNSTETDDVPPLPHLGLYLQQWQFEPSAVAVNRPIRRPAYWYGGGEHLELVLANYRQHKQYPHDNYRNAAIETPAPWGLDRIDMHFGLLDNEYEYTQTGQSVLAYVIDTGVRTTHQEFQSAGGSRAQFLANAVGDGVDTDCVGHGTHVASVLGGATYGVAKQVQIFAVKVLDCTGNGDLFTISAGVMAVVEHKNQQPQDGSLGFLASLSLGGDFSSALNSAVLQLAQNGIATAVAAGNDNADACQFSPSSLGSNSLVLSVGASTVQDRRSSFSNYGGCVSLSAPGSAIVGAWIDSDTDSATLSGTSMATPFVSGVVALVLQQNRTLSPAAIKALVLAWITPAAISQASNTGGGANLLYSLIDVTVQPDFTAPTPTQPPPPGFIPIDSAGPRTRAVSLSGILVIALWALLV